MNIYEKLAAITKELGVVNKGLEVGYGKSKYKAVSEVDVLNAVKPLEEKYKVYSYPHDRKLLNTQVIKKDDGKISYYLDIETTYRFVNLDNVVEYVDMKSLAVGLDSGDKGTGKAMTYADKYALMKAYKIITGDDPDKTHSNNYQPQQTEEQFKFINDNKDKIDLQKMLKFYKVGTIASLDFSQSKQVINKIKERLDD